MFYLNQLGMICPLGHTRDVIKRRMLDLAQSGVALNDTFSPGHPLPLGEVDAACPLPPVDELPLRDRSRNNQLALGALTGDTTGRGGGHRTLWRRPDRHCDWY